MNPAQFKGAMGDAIAKTTPQLYRDCLRLVNHVGGQSAKGRAMKMMVQTEFRKHADAVEAELLSQRTALYLLWTLRALLGHCVEALVLLDRLTYLEAHPNPTQTQILTPIPIPMLVPIPSPVPIPIAVTITNHKSHSHSKSQSRFQSQS